jgi:hypothetical protein
MEFLKSKTGIGCLVAATAVITAGVIYAGGKIKNHFAEKKAAQPAEK